MSGEEQRVTLADDGESGVIDHLGFTGRCLHQQLASVEAEARPGVILDALSLGAEMRSRVSQRGDLESLSKAVERLDEESTRIVTTTVERVDRTIEKTIEEMAATMRSEDGPLADLLQKFDPAVDGNVIDLFRDLVSSTAAKATKQAVKDLSEATHETMERLAKSMSVIEKVAAVEQARLAEAAKGTAKGLEHEFETETLLGELVSVTGDGLDDVSTVMGLDGNKKGDKVITPRNGCAIVTEEKCTARMSESKLRAVLEAAMANRGAAVGMIIVEDESKVPGNQPFHLIDDNKAVVVAGRLPLRMVYALLRAKAIELASAGGNVDDTLVVESVNTIRSLSENIRRALDRFKLLRTEHTKATKAIGQAAGYVDEVAEIIASDVTEIMMTIDALVIDDSQETAA